MRLSQEKILSVSKKTLKIAKEHVKTFSVFGITSIFLQEFEKEISDAEKLLTLRIQRIELKEYTVNKNLELQNCYNYGRELSIRLEIAFGKNSIEMNNFPSKELLQAQKNEEKMFILMDTIINIAEKYFSQLINFGFTEEILTKGKELKNALQESNNKQEQQKEINKKQTKDRKEKFSELYKTVNKINKIGRTIYKNTTEKHYFSSPWINQNSKNFKIYQAKINPVATKIILENLQVKTITLNNIGNSELKFYRTDNEEYSDYKTLQPTETKKIRSSTLGKGKFLKVFNNDENKIGEYKVLV